MNRILCIISLLLCSLLACFSQQRSIVEIVPLHIGTYPISNIIKSVDNKMEVQNIDLSNSYIYVSDKELSITINNEVVHKFLNTSIPRSGVEYYMYDEIHDCDVNVFIMYVKLEDSDSRYFGISVKYNNTTEYVFTYQIGTQIPSS